MRINNNNDPPAPRHVSPAPCPPAAATAPHRGGHCPTQRRPVTSHRRQGLNTQIDRDAQSLSSRETQRLLFPPGVRTLQAGGPETVSAIDVFSIGRSPLVERETTFRTKRSKGPLSRRMDVRVGSGLRGAPQPPVRWQSSFPTVGHDQKHEKHGTAVSFMAEEGLSHRLSSTYFYSVHRPWPSPGEVGVGASGVLLSIP